MKKRVDLEEIRYSLEGDIDDVINFLTDRKMRYEAEGYTDIGVDINSYDNYGSASVDVDLYGTRDETDAEIAQREASDNARKQYVTVTELAQLAALKAKYGEVK